MLEHHNTSIMAIDSVQRNDIPIIRDNKNQNHQSQRKYNEIETFKIRQYFKKGGKFLLSPIGLVCIVMVYAILGGFLFKLLEQHDEKVNCLEAQSKHRIELTKLKQKIVAYIQHNLTSSPLTPLTYSTVKDNTTVALEKIRSILYNYRDFVITTISKYGYYENDCSVITKWTYANSFLFAITIMTTVGLADITPKTWEGQICCICYATVGIPIYFFCAAKIGVFLAKIFRFIYSKVLCKPYYTIKRRRALARKAKLEEDNVMNTDNTSTKKTSSNILMNETNVDEEKQQRNEQVIVPLTITTLIIVVAVNAFDDCKPDQSENDANAGVQLIIRVVYKLFGIAMVGMLYDLMHKEIRAKFRWLGRKVGINKENKPPSTANSNPVMKTNGKMIENENEVHKLRLRNGLARVHPVTINSNKGNK